MKSPLLKYRPAGVAVSDLSAQLWCEQQLEFTLELGSRVTQEQRIGKDRHKELQDEVVQTCEVTPYTRADHLAINLYNAQVAIKGLLDKEITREVTLFGKINSLYAMGKIDELYFRNNKLFILDTKTRKRKTMPREAQKRTVSFQLMLYNYLLSNMITNNFTVNELMEIYELNSFDRISAEFEQEMKEIAGPVEPQVEKLSKQTFGLFQKLPLPERTMQIRYEHQGSNRLIGEEEFEFDPVKFQKDCDFVENFWLGKRKAIPVSRYNSWKCNYCQFSDICDANRIAR